MLFRFINYQFLSTILCDQMLVLLVMLCILSTSFREWGSFCACPYRDKQRLIKIPLKCLKAFLAPAFIKIPTLLFHLAQYIYHNFVWRAVYIEVVIYYQRFFGLGFHTLNLFLSPLPSLSLFLFLQLHPQNHFTCGSDVEEIIHRTGCSIGCTIPYN